MSYAAALQALTPADNFVAPERRRTLLIVQLSLALISLASIRASVPMPGAGVGPSLLFGVVGLGMLLLAALVWLKRIPYAWAAGLTLGLVFLLLLRRLVLLHNAHYWEQPGQGFFVPLYGYYGVFYLVPHMVLPYPLSSRVSLVAWLALAGITTAFLAPLWPGQAPGMLVATLMFVWLGHGLLVLLTHNWSRAQSTLVERFARVADSERQARADMQDSEARFHGIFDQAAVGIAMLNAQGRWLEINQCICDITGYSQSELLKLDFQAITHPDDLAKDVELAGQVIRHEIDTYAMEKRYIRKDGSVVWVDLSVSRLDGPTPEQDRFVSVIQDIGARKRAEQKLASLHQELGQRVKARTLELQESNERWQQRSQLLSAIAEMMGLLPSARDPAEACRIVSLSMPKIFPASRGHFYLRETEGDGSHYRALSDWGSVATTGPVADHECWALRRNQVHWVEPGEHSMHCTHDDARHSNGPALCLPLSVDGRLLGLVHVQWAGGQVAPEQLVLRTLQEQLSLALSNARMRAQLHTQALTDALTELGNRRHLESSLAAAQAAARRTHAPLSLLILDVDHFKSFNDRFGHDAGDLVLREVAGCLRRVLREDETAFRYGGEEFVVLLAKTDAVAAARCAERVRQAVAALSVHDHGQPLPPVTVSVGVACSPQGALPVQALLDEADAALYRAKNAGRNCVKLAA